MTGKQNVGPGYGPGWPTSRGVEVAAPVPVGERDARSGPSGLLKPVFKTVRPPAWKEPMLAGGKTIRATAEGGMLDEVSREVRMAILPSATG